MTHYFNLINIKLNKINKQKELYMLLHETFLKKCLKASA